MHNQEDPLKFYENHYDIVGKWFLRSGQKKVVLGDKENRRCRFCGKTSPEVSFRKVAHAIPELIGNKSIVSNYECDTCNEEFGRGIENDLGNWSKPTRTLVRIQGKNGVPTIKKGGDKSWRIEFDQSILNVTAYEDDPIFDIDEEKNTINFKLRRDAYTPVGVLKAFMKIGVTLMPDEEVPNFSGLIKWVKDADHSKTYLNNCPVMYTFQPGPMPNDLITALVLRRKNNVTGYPYAYLILGYGNEVFQVMLPSERCDREMNGVSFKMPYFPVPGHPDSESYGKPKRAVLDLMSSEQKKGDIMEMQMGYESICPAESPKAK